MKTLFLILALCAIATAQKPEGCIETAEDRQLGRRIVRSWHHIDCQNPRSNARRVTRAQFERINAAIIRRNKLPGSYNVVLDSDLPKRRKQ